MSLELPAGAGEDRDLPDLGDAAVGAATPVKAAPRPMPRWIPWMLGGTLLVVAAAFALPLLGRHKAAQPKPAVSPPIALAPAEPSWQEQLAALREITQTAAHTEEEANVATQTALTGIREAVEQLTGEVRALHSSPTAEASSVPAPPAEDGLRSAVDGLAKRIEDLTARVAPKGAQPAPTTAAQATPAAVTPPAGEAPAVQAAPTNKPPRKRRSVGRAAPPPRFQVLSLDLWAGEPQMLVADAGGGSRIVSVGQTVQGWRFTGADAPHREVILKAPSGREARYAVTGTQLASVLEAPQPTLTVDAEPADARIRVMNVGPAYYPGMPLAPGAYDVLVERDGYLPSRQWVQLEDDRVFAVRLSPAVSAER